jgi:hypothetical protein
MNLASEDCAGFFHQSIQRSSHPGDGPVDGMALDVTDLVTRVQLVPAAVEVLGDQPELDDQDARKIGRGGLTPLFAPEPRQRLLIIAHDDPRVGAANEVHAVRLMLLCFKGNRHSLWLSAKFLR